MTTELRVVVDTNVMVSAALFPRSMPRRVIELATRGGVLLLSESTLQEIDEVLRRPKFDKYVSPHRRLEFLSAMVNEAEIVPITQTVLDCRDVKDNKFLKLAICGRAGYVVTGDADLLALHPFRGIPLIKPEVFVSQLQK